MKDYEPPSHGVAFSMESLLQGIRAIAAVLGVIAVIIGVVYATRTFHLIYTALSGPETFQASLDQWASAVGGKELDVVIDGSTYPGAKIVAIIVLGGGAAILAWISMGLIVTGAKAICWTLGDREAVKKILVHAFGPQKRPDKPPAEEK